MTHTPTPWEIVSRLVGPLVIVSGDTEVAHVGADSFQLASANAAHIVKCVNLHDQMLITIGKLASGMKRGDEGWSKLDEEVYQLAMEAPHA